MLEIGSIVDGKYKILNKIGQGGMSVVYLAMNEKANKQWAIKEVRKDGKQNFEIVKQGLIAETDILKRLNHPNLPSIIDVIDGEGTFLIVMDYIEGKPLSDALKQIGPQPQEFVVEWAKQLCDVLNYLHTRVPPIIYRDMKPSNIMLKPDGNVTLIDFGTAREYKSGNGEDTTCLGTRGYAAPEQFGGQGQTDGRTDIYCLGATMYHLLTGHNPSKPPYQLYPIRHWNPELSSGLEEIILKCTQQNPDERYQNCMELMYALDHYNELDFEYKKKQKVKFGCFVASLSLAAVLGITSGVTYARENNLRNQTYDNYVAQAEEAANDDRFYEYIKEAVELDPSRADGFQTMLDRYTEDGVFTEEEYSSITKLRNENDHQMEADSENFAQFAYDMGNACWHLYGKIGEDGGTEYSSDKTKAVTWFSQVKEIKKDGQVTNLSNYNTSQIYVKIGEYYDKLGKVNSTNEMLDSDYRYSYLWDDMNALLDEDVVEPRIQMYIYKDFVTNIFQHASDFKADGITEEQLTDVLDEIDTYMQNNTNHNYANVENYITGYLPTARSQVERAFGSTAIDEGGGE